VVADWDGYRDTVVDGKTGVRVPTYWLDCHGDLSARSPVVSWRTDHLALAQSVIVDVEALAAALGRLLVDASLRRRMGDASRRRAVEHFAWNAIVRRYEALWDELGAEAARAPVSGAERPYLHAPYGAAYREYPTAWLRGDERVRVTASGRRVLDGDEGLPTYHPSGLDPALIERALARVAAGAAPLDPLARRLGPGPAPRRAILWLLKYGFVQFDRSSPRV
jgi:hypothetical protein